MLCRTKIFYPMGGSDEQIMQNALRMEQDVMGASSQLKYRIASNVIFNQIQFPFALEAKMMRLIQLERDRAKCFPQKCGCGLEKIEQEQAFIRTNFINDIKSQPQFGWLMGAQPDTPEEFILSTRPSAVKLEVQTRSFHYDFDFASSNTHDQEHSQESYAGTQVATAMASGSICSEITLAKIVKGQMNYSIQIDLVEDQTPPINLGGEDHKAFPLMVFDVGSSLFIKDAESRRVKDYIFSHIRSLDCPKDIFIEMEDSFVNTCKTGTFVVGRDFPWNEQFFADACSQGQGYQSFCQFVGSVPIVQLTLEKVIGFTGIIDLAKNPALVESRIQRLGAFDPKTDTGTNPNPVFGNVHLFTPTRLPYQRLRAQTIDTKEQVVSRTEEFHSKTVTTSGDFGLGGGAGSGGVADTAANVVSGIGKVVKAASFLGKLFGGF